MTARAPRPNPMRGRDRFRTDRERVVVGVSGSSASRVALRRAAEEARRLDRPLLVVRAWEPPCGEVAARCAPCPELDRELEFREAGRLDQILLDEWTYLADVRVRSWLVRARAAPALVEAARPGDLLVLGGGRTGSLAGLLRGATRRAVSTRARCRVLVTDHPEPDRPEPDRTGLRALRPLQGLRPGRMGE